jgi:hypothetical protein
MTEIIHFPAQIYKIQTTVDGAIRLTLDMPETQIDSARLLMECKMRGGLLEVAAVPIDQIVNPDKQNKRDTNGKSELETRNERKSAWQT